jgi:hypothetical protein
VHPARDQARPEAGHACGRRTHLAGVLGAASAERSESVAARSALRWAKPVQPAGVAASCGAGLAAPALGPPAKPPPADTETHQHIAGPPVHVEATGIHGGDPSRTLVTAPARERPGRPPRGGHAPLRRRDPRLDSVSGGSCATARSAGNKPLGPRKLWRAQEGIPCLHSVEGRCDRGAAPAGS